MARNLTGLDRVLSGIPATFLAYTGAVTLSMWVNISNSNTTFRPGVGLLDNSLASRGYGILVNGTLTTARWGGLTNPGAGQNNIDSGETLTINAWHHLGLRCTAGGAASPWNLWRDGAQRASGTNTITALQAGDTTGSMGINNNAAGTMLVADCAAWKANLTDLEMIALSNGIRPRAIRRPSLNIWLPEDGIQSPEPDLSLSVTNGVVSGTIPAFGPPITPFTPRQPQRNSMIMLPAAGMGWLINRRNKLMRPK